MRNDRLHKARGGRDNITFTTTDIHSTINTHNTELQMVKIHINKTKHITIANIYILPRDSTSTHYKTADTDIQHTKQSTKHHTTTNIFARYHHGVYTLYNRTLWKIQYALSSDYLPINPQSTYDITTDYIILLYKIINNAKLKH